MSQPAPPEIVLVSHYNLARVREILAADPSQLNVLYEPWAETPLGAASHVGNRPIAQYLLDQGAPLTVTTAAMLGMKEAVAEFFSADPAQAHASGAHGIPLLFHAALSGEVEVAAMVVEAARRGAGYANGSFSEQAGHALHAAVSKDDSEMTAWLLEAGADPSVRNFQGKTPLEAAEEAGQESIAGLLREYRSGRTFDV